MVIFGFSEFCNNLATFHLGFNIVFAKKSYDVDQIFTVIHQFERELKKNKHYLCKKHISLSYHDSSF